MHNVQIFFGDIAGDILGSSDGDMFRAAGQPDGGDPGLEDPGVRGPDEDPGHHGVREQQHHQHQRAHPRHRGPHEPRHREQANRDCSLAFLLYIREIAVQRFNETLAIFWWAHIYL